MAAPKLRFQTASDVKAEYAVPNDTRVLYGAAIYKSASLLRFALQRAELAEIEKRQENQPCITCDGCGFLPCAFSILFPLCQKGEVQLNRASCVFSCKMRGFPCVGSPCGLRRLPLFSVFVRIAFL
ncbi:TPA: hypothetical protein ACFNMY_001274 [Neisseria bacilliformis]